MKKAKILTVSCMCLLAVTGCFYQETSSLDIERGNHVCEGNGGLKSIRVLFNGVEDARCVNGAVFEKLRNYKKDSAGDS